jgi:PAS domain S-box-containing protein
MPSHSQPTIPLREKLHRTARRVAIGLKALFAAPETDQVYLRSLLDTSAMYVIRTDTAGNYTYCNRAFLDDFIAVEHRADFIGSPSLDYIIPDDHALTLRAVEHCFTSPELPVQVTLRKPLVNGDVRTTEWEFRAICPIDGIVSEIQGTGRDITERLQIQQELAESNERYRLLAENSLDLIALFSLEEKYMYISPSVEHILGFTPQELLGRTGYELLHPDEHLTSRIEIQNALLDGATEIISTNRFLHKDGTYRWLESKSKVLIEPGTMSVSGFQTASRDVTRTVELHQEQLHTEQILNETGTMAKIGGWDIDFQTNDITFTRQIYDIYELPGALPPTFDFLEPLKKVVKNSYPHSLTNLVDALKGSVPKDVFPEAYTVLSVALENLILHGTAFDVEVPVKTANGRPICLRSIGKAERESGITKRIYGTLQDITEQVETRERLQKREQELEESNARLKSLLGAVPFPISVTRISDGKILFANVLLQEMLALSEDISCFPYALDIYQNPEKRERIVRDLQLHGRLHNVELALKTTSGEERWVLASAILTEFEGETAILATFNDITENRLRDEKIRQSEANLRAIMDSSVQAFWLTDTDLRIVTYNKLTVEGVRASFGKDIVIGESILNYVRADDTERFNVAAAKALTGEAVMYEERIGLEDGTYQWFECMYLPTRNTNGTIIGLTLSTFNITERTLAYQSLAEMNALLERRVEERTHELIQVNNEKNEFLGVAAHDLRNPLTGILSSADILQRRLADDPVVQRFVKIIMSASDQMLAIITNLLDVNRIESGLVSLDIQPVPLTVLDSSIEEYQSRAAEKGIVIYYDTTAIANDQSVHSTSIQVLADKQLFRQVVDNLLSNAVKYSPQWKRVWVRLLVVENTEGVANGHPERVIRLEVQDEGPGISTENIKKLFGKFARLSARPTGGEHSTGLGLSIVKKLVELQHGRVWCESTLGEGTTFIVELPGLEGGLSL